MGSVQKIQIQSGGVSLAVSSAHCPPHTAHSVLPFLAPTFRNSVTIIEEPLQSLFHEQRRHQASEKPERRLVVYFIAKDCSIGVRLDYMPMPPTAERPFELHIFEQSRWIVNGVPCDPARFERSKNAGFNYGFGTKV